MYNVASGYHMLSNTFVDVEISENWLLFVPFSQTVSQESWRENKSGILEREAESDIKMRVSYFIFYKPASKFNLLLLLVDLFK